MFVFDTPGPVSVMLELGVARDVRIVASDRADTIVEAAASNPSDESDVDAARNLRADRSGDEVRITGHKNRPFDFSRRTRSADITVKLPAGSRVHAKVQLGSLRCEGVLGQLQVKTGMGDIRVERSGPARLETGTGHVTVDGIGGDGDIRTGSGKVNVGRVDGGVTVRNSNGDTEIDAVAGDVRVRSANGAIVVDQAGANVDVRTHHGPIRIGAIARGVAELGTSMGDLDLGIATGTAAWLDLETSFGQLRNLLDDVARPEEADDTVAVRGRTSTGNVTIHRA
ncbi:MULTISPECIES: DUF4097 family beta strand repeat-containing protein [Prauserella salsuginis group]|uniref:DUF4097 domain-containing protein n=1 Tax=Prauserella salsuginis TaxID=387889 RepID=A0ABW6G520_9PSEU|nr:MULTISPECIES: DUF4097 domain-containing protein [Prauserella salsuginis group]MCR3718855.1 DUF4097 and DUF4098 domain-containing protein YvlB [Prauserella flava]MCR3733425.1 DUF4097 and DUF4098 domain-containing protein YvlB [Prauserella salsuginis]